MIADVTLQTGGIVVVTGKGYGATNFIAMDRAGDILVDRVIQVEGPTDQLVTVYRGVERESYSCMPICQRRVTLGDGETYFKSAIDQAGSLSSQASGSAAAARQDRTDRSACRPSGRSRLAPPCMTSRESIPSRATPRKWLRPRLTNRVALLRSDETLQQSVSGKPRGQKIAVAIQGLLDVVARCRTSASFRNTLRRFRRNRRGSAAVEFALVAPVFFALLFAIIETAIVFFAGQVLETMTQDSARLIMTGQAQTASYTQAQFKTHRLRPIPVLFNCADIYVDVQSYPRFAERRDHRSDRRRQEFHAPQLNYCPGSAGDIVVVRVFYQWPLFVTGLGYNISNLTGSKRLLSATAAFRNEPFLATAAC